MFQHFYSILLKLKLCIRNVNYIYSILIKQIFIYSVYQRYRLNCEYLQNILVLVKNYKIYKKIENRICALCDNSKIENEMHFIFNCSLYKEERSLFFKQSGINLTYSLADNFSQLCNICPRKFAKYIQNIWCKRKETLYK